MREKIEEVLSKRIMREKMREKIEAVLSKINERWYPVQGYKVNLLDVDDEGIVKVHLLNVNICSCQQGNVLAMEELLEKEIRKEVPEVKKVISL